MDIFECECFDGEWCDTHREEEQAFWASHFRATRPSAADVENAYDSGDYKGKFFEGWDAA